MLMRQSKPRKSRLLNEEPGTHMLKVTSTEECQTQASDQAASIARWDDEGGAGRPRLRKTGPGRARQNRRPRRMVEERILGCLGATVIMKWTTLPKKIQRELFECAGSIGDLQQAPELKGQ